MPDPTTPNLSPSAQSSGAPQGSPDTATPGQPPIGSSPATQPVANRGLQAAGLATLSVVVRLLTEKVLPSLGATSEAGRDVLKALTSLSKHVTPGSVSTGVEQTALTALQNASRQAAPQIAAMRAAQPAAGGAPPPPGGAAGGPQIPPQLAALLHPQGNS